jgi:chromosome segregation ATPase
LDARNAGSRGQLAERITALEEIRGNLIQSAAVHKEQSDALVADLRGRLQVLENETGRLTREHGEAVAELGVRREEVQRLSGELGGAQARLGELENERGELMRGLSELSSEVARLRQSADDLQRLVVEGESALAAARNEKAEVLLEVARLQAAADEAKTTAQSTAKERDALKQNVDERFRELAQLTRMIQERDRALADKEAAHLKSQQALERASQTRVAALENERNTLQHSVNERFRELAHLTQMLLHRDVALEDARAAAQKMKQSFSWKVSAPVRWLGRALGGGSSVRRRLAKQKALLEQSGLFDAAWYRSTYPDVVESGQDPAAHYLRHGAKEGRNPGPKFDTQNYLKRYPDVSKAEPAINPLLHYVLHGQKEGRSLS